MILVTGGTGLLGSHLLFKLVSEGEKVRAIYRKSSSKQKTRKVFSYYCENPDELMEKVNWIKGDVLDYFSVSDAMKGVDKVFHTAAVVSFHSSDKGSLGDINVEGTKNVVDACLERKNVKLVHVSSIGALGRAGSDGVVNEDNHWNGKKSSNYSTSKYHSEMEVWRAIAEGLDAVIINPSIILGPGNWEAGSSKLFTTMHNGLKYHTTGINGFVDVLDVAEIMIKLMESNITGDRFIVNSENVCYRDLFFRMADALKVPRPSIHANRKLSEIAWRVLAVKAFFTGKKSSITRETAVTANQRYNYSNNKIVEALSYKFIPVLESVDRNVELFVEDLK